MNSISILIITLLIFVIAYRYYARYLEKNWGIDKTRKTPAHKLMDGIDYIPSKYPVLMGHHFSSIAGAGPIVGPIVAITFGWVPAVLWVIVGCVFFGGVHDMGSIYISTRSDGKSIGEVIRKIIGKKGKLLFVSFAYLALVLVVAAFMNIVADAFIATPEALTISLLFMVISVIFGFFLYKKKTGLLNSSIVGIIGLALCIYIGNLYPIIISKNIIILCLVIYIFVASVAPVWILLQPRDYLNSFLLYGIIIGGVLGIIFYNPKMTVPMVTTFRADNNYIFPMLFVTIACGAISGFHSLVGSGTTSKQIDNEENIKIVGYGSMLIEGVLAIIAIITASYIAKNEYTLLMKDGGPINVFSNGLGEFMKTIGIPIRFGKSFTTLSISAFALTTLDTATRLARFLLQEFFYEVKTEKNSKMINLLSTKQITTTITVVLGTVLGLKGYLVIWPIFASANQLLSALALLTLTLWLKEHNKNYRVAMIPMCFMFLVTVVALIFLMVGNIENILLFTVSFLLFILALIFFYEAKRYLKVPEEVE